MMYYKFDEMIVPQSSVLCIEKMGERFRVTLIKGDDFMVVANNIKGEPP